MPTQCLILALKCLILPSQHPILWSHFPLVPKVFLLCLPCVLYCNHIIFCAFTLIYCTVSVTNWVIYTVIPISSCIITLSYFAIIVPDDSIKELCCAISMSYLAIIVPRIPTQCVNLCQQRYLVCLPCYITVFFTRLRCI